jgi:polyamine oxidase
MAVDYFIYDYEFAEPPRVTSLQNTQPTPTNADFGEDNYFVADQRGFESIIHSIGSSYLSTDGNGKLSDRRILLNKVPADAELLVRFLHLEFFF